MYKFNILLVFCLLSTLVMAQLPNTQAYLFDMRQVNDNTYQFSNAKYLSNFNKMGYNNQPHFVNERTLYMSVQEKGGTQTDIYSFNLYRQIKTQVTNTPDSEYSPTSMPDGYTFSCVREEFDGKKTQRLWQFPLTRNNNGKRVFEDITEIGYHYWLSPEEVALFIVGEPHELILVNTRTDRKKRIDTNIGRSLQQFPNGHLVYLQKASETTWHIKSVDPQNGRSKIILESLRGSEDFIVATDGTIFSGRGSRLYKHNPAIDSGWIEIGDFSAYGIRNITRLAYNGNRKLVLINKK